MSSAPPKSLQGPCVVCGKSTYLRCGECAKHGTNWIYFCSVAHQGLIWVMHKNFCGARSNPFTWPTLTREEIDEMVQLCETPVRFKGEPRLNTWLDTFAEDEVNASNRNSIKWEFREYLESLMNFASDGFGAQQNAIYHSRMVACSVRADAKKSKSSEDNIPKWDFVMAKNHPVDFLARNIEKLGVPEVGVPGSFPWQSEFLHLQSVYIGIVFRYGEARDNNTFDPELKEYVKHIVDRTVRFLKEKVEPTRPDIASSVRAFMLISPE
ncbi:zinc finger MYND domain-containing protein [Sporobolomyces salmoneus]|uniref:zinc finger MYND domain-containing protein n=1 Tax=Sporobolomyces salmoneus TaxID=183962 RepID=UPI00316CF38F